LEYFFARHHRNPISRPRDHHASCDARCPPPRIATMRVFAHLPCLSRVVQPTFAKCVLPLAVSLASFCVATTCARTAWVSHAMASWRLQALLLTWAQAQARRPVHGSLMALAPAAHLMFSVPQASPMTYLHSMCTRSDQLHSQFRRRREELRHRRTSPPFSDHHPCGPIDCA
jgi:hypothetical protein